MLPCYDQGNASAAFRAATFSSDGSKEKRTHWQQTTHKLCAGALRSIVLCPCKSPWQEARLAISVSVITISPAGFGEKDQPSCCAVLGQPDRVERRLNDTHEPSPGSRLDTYTPKGTSTAKVGTSRIPALIPKFTAAASCPLDSSPSQALRVARICDLCTVWS